MEANGLFIPEEAEERTSWLVKDFIPLGGYCLFASQPGVGKSYLLEALAVDVAYGRSFLGMDTLGGDVLLVDEDSDPPVARARLARFCGSDKPKHQLFVWIGEGFRITDGQTHGLKSLIRRPAYKNVKLVIIDSLAGVVGGKSNLDNTKDSSAITEFLMELCSPDRAIVVVHHISTKHNLSVSEAMTCDNPDRLVMNNTRLVSSSQGYYVLASPTKGGKLEELFVRPVMRRVLLGKPFSASLCENGSGDYFKLNGAVFQTASGDLGKSERRILSEFPLDGETTVKSLDDQMDGFFHTNTLRTHLDALEDKGYIEVVAKHGKGGTHYYALTDKGVIWSNDNCRPNELKRVKLFPGKKGKKGGQ